MYYTNARTDVIHILEPYSLVVSVSKVSFVGRMSNIFTFLTNMITNNTVYFKYYMVSVWAPILKLQNAHHGVPFHVSLLCLRIVPVLFNCFCFKLKLN